MPLFQENAPRYWAAGLPVIPLRPRQKAPIPSGWQVFCGSMPDQGTQDYWLANYPDSNVGLPLGPQSGLVAIDLDTDDAKIRMLIEKLIPPTPWIRRGAKGAVYIYRTQDHRTFRIKQMDGKTLVECLAKGTQIVLPPSIHPDTQRPYEANCHLTEVLDKIPVLQRDIETILRQALSENDILLSTKGSARMVEWVASGARDSSMTSIAGLEARAVVRGERTLAEAFGEIETWIANFTEKVAGDSLDPQKARLKILEFIKRDIYEGGRALPQGWDEGLAPEEAAFARKEFGADSEEWSVEQNIEHIQDQFERHDRGSKGRREAIEHVLMRMSRSNLTAIDKETVLGYISACSGKTITLAVLRRRMRELEMGDVEGTDHTEIAQLLIKEIERFGQIRYYGNKFWQWGGSHWVELPETRLFETLAKEFGTLAAARKYNDHRGVVKVATHLVDKGLKESSLVGINFANGFLTSDLVLHPHAPEFGCTYALPYLYDPSRVAAPQRFLSFLYDCWGGDEDYEDKVKALRQAFAVTMFGQAHAFQRAFCLFGQPHSGKSVVAKILLGLMPEGTVCNVRPHDWADKFLPAEMFGRLINFCGELSETEMIAGDRFKSIVDGDEMSAQQKNRDIFKFRPTCAHWFASNHIPRTRDSSSGFTRRWLFWHFTKAVSKENRIALLEEEILAEERDAIAVWAVQAMPELLTTNDFTFPKSHEAQVLEMAGANNSVRFFLTASEQVSLAQSDEQNCSETQLHTAYWFFCKNVAHVPPVALKTFRLRMQELQVDLGFRLKIMKSPAGIEAAYYTNLTLAEKEDT